MSVWLPFSPDVISIHCSCLISQVCHSIIIAQMLVLAYLPYCVNSVSAVIERAKNKLSLPIQISVLIPHLVT